MTATSEESEESEGPEGPDGPDGPDGLEAALAATEERVDAALGAVAAVTRELRKAKTGAARGQVRDLRRALGAAAGRIEEAARATGEATESFDFDEREHLAAGGFVKELLAQASARGVRMFEADGQLLCYPSLVKVLPSDAAVEVDRRRERRLRPSVLVALLGDAQAAAATVPPGALPGEPGGRLRPGAVAGRGARGLGRAPGRHLGGADAAAGRPA